jgi:hypothetical protein
MSTSNFGIIEIIFFLLVIIFFIATPIYLGWLFIRRAKFKEKTLLMDKGIDIKDLSMVGNRKIIFPWLRIGIVITGVGLGSLISGKGAAIIILCTGLSFILAHFIGGTKGENK